MRVEVSAPVRREATPSAPSGAIVFHPRYERFLRRLGLDSADAVLALRGEIICGHPDRHVARVELGSRVVFLKREHVVGLRTRIRNRFAGFGPVSRSEREARTLQQLEAAGLPGPQWLAYGEDGYGRAFLLVDELAGMSDLRTLLSDNSLSSADRRELAGRLGVAIAELHSAGFGTPELAAKHVFVSPATYAATLIDWQSSMRRPPTEAECVRQLATLHASLPDDLATPRERLRFARTYLRLTNPTGRFSQSVRAILAESVHRSRRSSARDQRHAHPAPRLVWLAEEAVCVVPELVADWPTPAVCEPFYPTRPTIDEPSSQEWVTFPSGRRGLVVRFTNVDPLGRFVSAIRERPWRSPATVASRILIQLQRAGIPAPQLLAFGQRFTSSISAQSFVLYEALQKAVPVALRLSQTSTRGDVLRECVVLLRRLHDAGCRPSAAPAFVVAKGTVGVDSPFAVRLAKRLTDSDRQADLTRLLRSVLHDLPRTERGRLIHAYLGDAAGRFTWKRWLARLA